MSSGFVPKGNYSLKNLIERVVERRHESNAIVDVTIHGGEHRLEAERAGKRISKKEDDERWDSAREIIRQALEAGTLTSWFEDSNTEDSNTQEKYIQKSDWAIPKGDSFADSYATLSYGTLQHGNRGLRGTVVYVRIKEADVFLRALTKVSLRDQFISEAAKIIKKRPGLQAPELLQYQSLQTLIRDSGVSLKHIKKNWIPKARTLARTTGKTRKGAPKKTR